MGPVNGNGSTTRGRRAVLIRLLRRAGCLVQTNFGRTSRTTRRADRCSTTSLVSSPVRSKASRPPRCTSGGSTSITKGGSSAAAAAGPGPRLVAHRLRLRRRRRQRDLGRLCAEHLPQHRQRELRAFAGEALGPLAGDDFSFEQGAAL
ncbi:hypothetical protein SAMN02745121_07492 [Nannocystis exedens]|uniref:Uncharacterized protein n=1 Tax=Nannocystis exedens TaxID=54 RepID=A0A1I2GTQ2_9BACT|nr:hypothetical protein SAMN02745121_07492 [Nannocystis exedens]